jgi:uncharacterized membrane protein YecN with MAPEG domain
MTSVPITLGTAAAAVFVNAWLANRVGSLRRQFKIGVGDGGNEAVLRRMRAQANFVESTPFFLLLVLALELSGASPQWLAVAAALFLLARIAHAIGMEGGSLSRWRMLGMMGSSFALVGVAIWALRIVLGR